MEENGQTEQRLRLGHVQGSQRVTPDVIGVVMVELAKAHAGPKLRDQDADHVGVLRQKPRRVRAAEKPCQLFFQTLRRNEAEGVFLSVDGGGGGVLDGKTQTGGKAQRPQHPQGVLGKALFRVAHTAQNAVFQVFRAAEAIDDPAVLSGGHGVDGEVPAGQVLPQAAEKKNAVGMTAVGIAGFGPEGGDLKGLSVQDHRHRTVLRAGQHRPQIGKAGGGLLGTGVGAQVPVLGRQAQQAVPDAATHGVGGKTALPQALQEGLDPFGKKDRLFHHFRDSPQLGQASGVLPLTGRNSPQWGQR